MSERPRGIVTEVSRFSTHDGPGIRTTVFLKGCPLRCSWCSSPETQDGAPELFVLPERCRAFGQCEAVCPDRAVSRAERVEVDRDRCSGCMQCVAACPNRVFRAIGREVGVPELMAELSRDRPFYVRGGGATLSGGEPLYQGDFVLAVLRACRSAGIGTVLDTCGLGPAEVAREAAELADLVLLDLKHMDGQAHEREVGVDNRVILDNAVVMAEHARIRICVPLVPGFNDSEDNVRRTAQLGRALGAEAVDLQPLHVLGLAKYRALGRPSPYERYAPPAPEQVRRLASVVQGVGLEVTVGRMM